MCYKILCVHCNWELYFDLKEHFLFPRTLFARTFFVPANIFCSREHFLFGRTIFELDLTPRTTTRTTTQLLLGPLSRARGQKGVRFVKAWILGSLGFSTRAKISCKIQIFSAFCFSTEHQLAAIRYPWPSWWPLKQGHFRLPWTVEFQINDFLMKYVKK